MFAQRLPPTHDSRTQRAGLSGSVDSTPGLTTTAPVRPRDASQRTGRHTHHRAGAAGNEGVAGHRAEIGQEIGDVRVRRHTFRFIQPSATAVLKIPNACTSGHADKSNGWAAETLKSWPEFSPWRVGG